MWLHNESQMGKTFFTFFFAAASDLLCFCAGASLADAFAMKTALLALGYLRHLCRVCMLREQEHEFELQMS